MSSETLPNYGLPQVAIPSPNKYVPANWVNKPHPLFGFLEVQGRDGVARGWLQFMPPQGFLIFGRDLGAAHVFVGHPSVSNQHAVAAWDVRDGKCYILDLESEHGTFVNETVIEHSVPVELRPGARVRFGQSAHLYVFQNLPAELVDQEQEAPVTDRDRGIDTRTEASLPRYEEGFDVRSEPRQEFDRQPPPQTPPFRGDGPPLGGDSRQGPPFRGDGHPLGGDPRQGPPFRGDGPPPGGDRRQPHPFRGDGPPPDRDHRQPPFRGDRPPPDMDRRMDRRDPPSERWSPPPRRFDDRRPDGPGPRRGMSPPRHDDLRRFDGPPRTPPHARGGRPLYRDGPRSPSPQRGRRSPPRDMRSPRRTGRSPTRRGFR